LANSNGDKGPVRSDANFTKLHDAMKSVTIWTPDWAQVLKDLPADVGRWTQAIGKLT
jgi:2-aminoethylphosphonate transport system substrate-binding protein